MSLAAEVDAAAQAAQAAFKEWRRVPPQNRVQYLFKLKALMEERLEDLARVVTQEHGKSLEEARGSVARGIEHLEVADGNALAHDGLQPRGRGRRPASTRR